MQANGIAVLEWVRGRLGAALVGAAALCGLATPAAGDEGTGPRKPPVHLPDSVPGAVSTRDHGPTLVARGGRPGGARSYPTTYASSGRDRPSPLAQDGWRFGTQIAPIFPMSDLGDSRDLLAATTGFSPRLNVGYERMFGNLGITPGVALQLGRFGMRYQDGSVVYIGVQPNVQAALHLGRFAPYASLGLGFDNFRLTGPIGDVIDDLGGNTSASGLGLDLQLGANVLITSSLSAGVAWQIHPGFTSFRLVDGATTSGGMAFMSVLFGVTYLL